MSKTTNTRTGSVFQSPTQGGDRSFIPDGSVSTDKLQDLAVDYAKLKDSANPFYMLGGGFQNFIDTSNKLTATTTTGTPATGTFYSSITNRASIVDLTQDLKPRMGVERITVQSIYQLQNEFGPNGEPVWGVMNDINGLVRFVGSGWGNINSTEGPMTSTDGADDYVEIVFYGTGLNYLGKSDGTRTTVASIDGGSYGSDFHLDGSNIISARNYSSNQILSASSGLTQGVHTIRIKNTSGGIRMFGFEILNESSSIKVQPGISYSQGKKATNSAQQALSYNSSFESGVLGTKGGRVSVYQKSDGTLGKALTPTNTSQLTLTSADHTNEEVVRTYFPREFGAGRADDYSLGIASINRAFTLDDGTTSLVGQNNILSASYTGGEALTPNSTSDFLIFTFVGTGLDLLLGGAPGPFDNATVSIDGAASAGNIASAAAAKIVKIVSGLSYGTHTVKITRSAVAGYGPGIVKFIVYQPKKPVIPVDAIELADFNVMADYVATSTVSSESLSTGSLYKADTREVVYVGTWGAITLNTGILSGFYTNTTTASSYLEYTFFGAGIEVLANSIGSTTVTIQIDGVAYTGAATARGTSAVWTSGTSTWTVSNDTGGRLQISGLTPGAHKIRVTWATGNFFFHGLCVIPLLYSAKSNIYADLQNTLSVGSNSLCDERVFEPIRNGLAVKKNWTQAIGITSGPTTTSTSFIPCPDMSCTIKTNGGDLKISYSINAYFSSGGSNWYGYFQIYVNGVAVGTDRQPTMSGTGLPQTTSDTIKIPVGSGVHKVDVYWKSGTGNTFVANTTERSLLVEEV